MERVLYLPGDGEVEITWYISQGRAAGVENIKETFAAVPVGRRTGFSAPARDAGPTREPRPRRRR